MSTCADRMRLHRARQQQGRGRYLIELDTVRIEGLLEHEGLLPVGVNHSREDIERALRHIAA